MALCAQDGKLSLINPNPTMHQSHGSSMIRLAIVVKTLTRLRGRKIPLSIGEDSNVEPTDGFEEGVDTREEEEGDSDIDGDFAWSDDDRANYVTDVDTDDHDY
ncbi:hypothetical protein PR001_g16474 [Phytophthora rubi]|uniref:Uncharacterized protein n=1 Tax=Phytophthora rubi TaxID=129364 RepID=A0A6A3KUK7_9STRA|nr:hypothetical protein PR001_g16474 [Phytophthora rubi]